MKVAHSFVFIRVKSWSVARGRMDVAARLKSCYKFLQCKNLEHDLSRAEKSCSVIWRSYEGRMTVVFNRMKIVFSRMKIVFSRVQSCWGAWEETHTTFIRFNTIQHDFHTPFIRLPYTWTRNPYVCHTTGRAHHVTEWERGKPPESESSFYSHAKPQAAETEAPPSKTFVLYTTWPTWPK